MSFGENVAEIQPPLVVRLWQRWRPREGYAVLLLTWIAVLMLPLALTSGKLLEGIGPAQWLATVALAFAWYLAHTKLRGWQAAIVLFVSGLAATLYWGVYVVRLGPLLRQTAAWLGWAAGARASAPPSLAAWAEQAELLASFAQRLSAWVQGLVTGRGGLDNLVVLFMSGLLVWGLAAWAGWWVARRGQAITALLPTGVVLAQHTYWAPDTLWASIVFIATAATLAVIARYSWHLREWERTGVDYAEDIRLDVFVTALAVGLLVMGLAPTIPSIASGELSRRFWEIFKSPYEQLEQQMGRSFESVRPARSLVPPSGAAEGGLPRAHLLGGARELGTRNALRVAVRGNTTGLQLYWRGQTYATYTGQGWEDHSPAETLRLNAGEPWTGEVRSGGARTLVSTVQVTGASRSVIYGPSEPAGVDRPYRARLRGPGELIALSPQSPSDRYTVLSRAIPPEPARLRSAGENYTPAIEALYLQLPDSIDPRLRAVAAEWTAGAETPYDAAVAIEGELRKIPYSLDLPTPPPDQDLVSWFLFDLRRGYCDYYASAMVVLARLRGIPARLAIGYATGEFDESTGQYVVTELNAHSWPELYFPGVGWIPFEPTGGRPLPERPADSAAWDVPPTLPSYVPGPEDFESGLEQLQSAAASTTAETRRRTAGQSALALLNGLALTWAVWLAAISRGPRPLPAATAGHAFGRLLAWGRRLGVRPVAGSTPREYAAQIGLFAEQTAARNRLSAVDARGAAATVERTGAALAEAYERELFGPAGTGEQPEPGHWRDLWSALRRVWLVKIAGSRQ